MLHLLLLFLIYLSSFIDSSQTNYLKIYRTDLRQIFWVVGVMAVDDQSEISFFDLSRNVGILLVSSTE